MNALMVGSKTWLTESRRFGEKHLFSLMLVAALLCPSFAKAAITPEDTPQWFVNMSRFAQSAHGAFSCEKCHGDMKQGSIMHPDSENPAFLATDAARQYDYGRCKACHKASLEQYRRGAHAEALLKEQRDAAKASLLPETQRAPNCGDCHSSHYAKAHRTRVEIGRQMVSVCGRCHPAQAATYLDGYHGKAAVNLGNKNAAFCTDCHGAHHCLSLKEKKETLAVCQRCHPEATTGFTQVVIHPTLQDLPGDNKQKKAHVALIRVVTVLMAVLVILVVGFFYGHSFAWILRELHEKLRKHK